MAPSTLGSRLAHGAFWSIVGTITSRGSALLSTVLVGRLLGKEGYGELGVIQNTIGIGTVVGYGLGLTANKFVAEFKRTAPERAARVLSLAAATAWISSGVMALLLIIFAGRLSAGPLAAPHLTPLLQMGGALLLLMGINGAQTGALAGFEAFKRIARINLYAGLITCPLMVVGSAKWGVAGAVSGLILSQVVNCALCFFAVRAEAARYHVPQRLTGCLREIGLFWHFSVPAVLTSVLNSAVAWGATALVLNQPGGYGDMGIYNAAVRIKCLPEVVVSMLIAPMLPILSEAHGKGDRATFQRTLAYSFLVAGVLIVPMSLVQAAAPYLTLLPFGGEYAGHPEIIRWLMLHAVMYALLFPMYSVLISMGKMWFSLAVNVAFTLLFASAAVFLVPRFGAAGYAAATALAYGVANVPSVLFLRKEFPGVMSAARWPLACCLATGLFALCVFGLGTASAGWQLTGGIASGLVFCSVGIAVRVASWRRDGLRRRVAAQQQECNAASQV